MSHLIKVNFDEGTTSVRKLKSKAQKLKEKRQKLDDELAQIHKQIQQETNARKKLDVEQQTYESAIKKQDLHVVDFVPEDFKGKIEPYRYLKSETITIDNEIHEKGYFNWLRSVTYTLPAGKLINGADELAETVVKLVRAQKVDWKSEGIEFLTVFTTESHLTRTIRGFQAYKLNDITKRFPEFAEEVVDQWDKAGYEGYTLGAEPIKIVKIIYRLIAKIGGCHKGTCDSKREINGMFVLSPKAINNNCFIMCCLKARKLKIKPATIRKTLKIERGKMIDFIDAEKIAKFLKINVVIMDEEMEVLKEIESDDKEDAVKIILSEKHYYVLLNSDFKTKTCKKCGKPYKSKHNCNKNKARFYSKRILCNVPALDAPVAGKHWKELCMDCIVYDFETFHDTMDEMRHVVYSVGWYDFKIGKYDKKYGKDALDTFMNYVLKQNEAGRECTLVSYNGSGFDHYFINKWLHSSDIKIDQYSYRHGQIQSLKFNGMNKTCDLYLFMNPFSLEKACEAFKINIHKSSFPHRYASKWNDVYYKGPVLDPKHYPLNMRGNIPNYENNYFDFEVENLRYLEIDVMCTVELLKVFSVEMSNIIGLSIFDFMTISQMGWDKWRSTLQEHEDIRLFKFEDQYAMAESCLAGGRTTPFKKHFKSKYWSEIMANKFDQEKLKELYSKCDDYLIDGDVVGLYPTAMLEKFPLQISKYSDSTRVKELQRLLNTKQYDQIPLCMMKVDVTPNDKLIVPVIHCKDQKNVTKWNYEHHMNQTYVSIDVIEAHKRGYQFRILRCAEWGKDSNIFANYVHEVYKVKQEEDRFKSNKDASYNQVRRACAKMLLNSLYGKTCQKRIDEVHVVVQNQEEAEKFFKKYKWADFDHCGQKFILVGTHRTFAKTISKPIQLGAFVLAYSRKIMNELVDLLDPDRYTDVFKSLINTPWYTDTDSLFFHCSQLDRIKHKFAVDGVKELGQLDDELEGGKIIEAYFLAPKLYCVLYLTEDGELKIKMRAKGIKNELLKIDDFRKMYFNDYAPKYEFDMLRKMKRHLTSQDVKSGHQKYTIITCKDQTRRLNQTEWSGRTAIDEVNTVPVGFNEKLFDKLTE